MNPQTKHNFKRLGVRVTEEVEIEMELHGEDKDKFTANPAAYLKAAIEGEGFSIRELKVDGLEETFKKQASGKGPIRFKYAMYHIVWDRDRTAICMWTPR